MLRRSTSLRSLDGANPCKPKQKLLLFTRLSLRLLGDLEMLLGRLNGRCRSTVVAIVVFRVYEKSEPDEDVDDGDGVAVIDDNGESGESGELDAELVLAACISSSSFSMTRSSWQNLRRQSNTIGSETAVGVVVCGGGANLPSARKFCSSSSNCPIKLKLGDIIGRQSLTSA